MDQPESGGEWSGWTVQFPRNGELPGSGETLNSGWDFMVMMIEFLQEISPQTRETFDRDSPTQHDGLLGQLLDDAMQLFGLQHFPDQPGVHSSLSKAAILARRLPRECGSHPNPHHQLLIGLLEDLRHWIDGVKEKTTELRLFGVLVDLALAIFRGLLKALFPKLSEFAALWDDSELRDWLRANGAGPSTLDSGVLRAIYELAFAYEDGDPQRPALAAGSGLCALLRICAGYKGAILWRMNAGMGDTIFSPLFQVLSRRGVRFQFFQRVERLELDPSGRTVAAIQMTRQCRTKNDQPYGPVQEVRGVVSWPSEPYWDQLEEGARQVDFESFWSDNPLATPYTLLQGRDFDQVVLGISQGSLPIVAADLVARSTRWQIACEKVKTVQTQAAQFWLRPTRRGLGWRGPITVLTSYAQPMTTWGDMSHLTDREAWPEDRRPGNTVYLCGAMPGPAQVPGKEESAFPRQQRKIVQDNARQWLDREAGVLWPEAIQGGKFDDRLFVTAADLAPDQRFDAQYFRANIDPSERYVQTIPGSTKHRLTSKDPEFDNLFLAGDWVAGCINGGCVEGAVVGGMQAARALCGIPEAIQGE